ncbi:ferredoxin III, nif-specific [Vibrio sp. RC27]
MANITGKTKGGADWEPQFISEVDQDNCIGCGRCYKVCSRNVFNLIEKAGDEDEDDDYYDEDEMMMVMTIENEDDCIGCMACAKVCPKDCQTFSPAAA